MIEKIKKCTGCTACINICPKAAIQMEADDEGFLYPDINADLCIECNLCDKVCPVLQDNSASDNNLTVYAVKNKDTVAREVCASGGIFSALSYWIIERGGCVYGAAFDKNFGVIHMRAENKRALNYMSGSKYPQSVLGDTFQELKRELDNGRNVLFSGTPCQVDGLKKYLGKTYDSLYLCDVICHGVMSPRVFADFIDMLKKKYNSEVKSICFRDKKENWINQRWKYQMGSGKIKVDDTYILQLKKLYYDHLCIRPSCHECRYANLNRTGDLTIGDYWGIDSAVPEFRDSLGVSCVLVNTEKGQMLFNEISERVDFIQTPTEKCIQPQLEHPSECSERRDEFWQSYQINSFEQMLKKYAVLNIKDNIKSKIPINVRNKLKGI